MNNSTSGRKPYERTIIRLMGEQTIYKQKKINVAWCEKCNSQIMGNGSIVQPYSCECRSYKYKDGGYIEND